MESKKSPRPWSSLWTLWLPLTLVVAAVVSGYVYPLFPHSSVNCIAGTTDNIHEHVNGHANPQLKCSCEVSQQAGMVDDCCCEYRTVDELNQEQLHPILTQLVKKPFFTYFKVRLWCNCPFWPDDGMCHLKDCSVCECGDDEIPSTFRKPSTSTPLPPLKRADDPLCFEDPRGVVDRSLESGKLSRWSENDNPWTADDESSDDEMIYVNLQLNPERYTGYKGVSARRIWEAIYNENCFQGGPDPVCTERRVFYRLISGLHSSITIHLAHNYLLDEKDDVWGPNLEIYEQRIHSFPQRLQNLYFTFLFVLRAATKAAAFLSQAEYSTGHPSEDLETLNLVKQLVQNEKLASACPVPFDEAQLWRGQEGPLLRQQLKEHFRNISAIMDCVGCEKCRLWGKLQILGLATSMKILFSESDTQNLEELVLQRNEVIALVNTLGRFSESLQSAAEMAKSLHEKGKAPGAGATTGLLSDTPFMRQHGGASDVEATARLVDVLLPS